MRRSLILTAAMLAVLSATACDREREDVDARTSNAETLDADESPAAGPREADLPAANTAAGFAARAAQSDMFEIASSQLALTRSQSPEVKAFAQRMVADHTRMSNEMKAALAEVGSAEPPPSQLSAENNERLTQLREASAEDFDDRYIDLQTEAHENALALLRDYGANGDTPRLKQLATRGAPMIESHLQAARALDQGPADDEAGSR